MSDPIKKVLDLASKKGKTLDRDKVVERLSDDEVRGTLFNKQGKALGYDDYDTFENDLRKAGVTIPTAKDKVVGKIQGAFGAADSLPSEAVPERPLPDKPTPTTSNWTAPEPPKPKQEETWGTKFLKNVALPSGLVQAVGAAKGVADYMTLAPKPKELGVESVKVQNPELYGQIIEAKTALDLGKKGAEEESKAFQKYGEQGIAIVEKLAQKQKLSNLSPEERKLGYEILQDPDMKGYIDIVSRTGKATFDNEQLKADEYNLNAQLQGKGLPVETMHPFAYSADDPQIKEIRGLKAIKDGEFGLLGGLEKRQLKEMDGEYLEYLAQHKSYERWFQHTGKVGSVLAENLKSKYGKDIFNRLSEADPNTLSPAERYALTTAAEDPDFLRLQFIQGEAQKYEAEMSKLALKYPKVLERKAKGDKVQQAVDDIARDNPKLQKALLFGTSMFMGMGYNSVEAFTGNRVTEYEKELNRALQIPEYTGMIPTKMGIAPTTRTHKPFRSMTATLPNGNEALYDREGNFIGVFEKGTGLKISTADPKAFDQAKEDTNYYTGVAAGLQVMGEVMATIKGTQGGGKLLARLKKVDVKDLSKTDWKLVAAATTTLQYNNRWIAQGLEQGMTYDEAAGYSLSVSAVIGMMQMVYGFEAGVARSMTQRMWQGLTKQEILKLSKNPATFMAMAGKVLKDVAGENLEESLEQLAEFQVNRATNSIYDTELEEGFKDYREALDEFQQIAFITSFATGPISAMNVGQDSRAKRSKWVQEYWLAAAQDPEKYKATVQGLREQGMLDAQTDYREGQVEYIHNTYKDALADEKLSIESKRELVELAMEDVMLNTQAGYLEDPASEEATKLIERRKEIEERIDLIVEGKVDKERRKEDLAAMQEAKRVQAEKAAEQAEVAESEVVEEQVDEEAKAKDSILQELRARKGVDTETETDAVSDVVNDAETDAAVDGTVDGATEGVQDIDSSYTPNKEDGIAVRKASTASKVLNKLGINVKFKIYKSAEERARLSEYGAKGDYYDAATNTIHVDGSKDVTRVIHESWHPILNAMKAQMPQKYNQLRDYMYSEVNRNPYLNQFVGKFAGKYVDYNLRLLGHDPKKLTAREKTRILDKARNDGRTDLLDETDEALTEFLTQVTNNTKLLSADGKRTLAQSILQTFKKFGDMFLGIDTRSAKELSDAEVLGIIKAASKAFSGDTNAVAELEQRLKVQGISAFEINPVQAFEGTGWAILFENNNLAKTYGRSNVRKVTADGQPAWLVVGDIPTTQDGIYPQGRKTGRRITLRGSKPIQVGKDAEGLQVKIGSQVVGIPYKSEVSSSNPQYSLETLQQTAPLYLYFAGSQTDAVKKYVLTGYTQDEYVAVPQDFKYDSTKNSGMAMDMVEFPSMFGMYPNVGATKLYINIDPKAEWKPTYEGTGQVTASAERIEEAIVHELRVQAMKEEGIQRGDPNTLNRAIQYSIIGERGATALDISQEVTFRRDNLGVARSMEAANKDVKAIRLATGWERGVDGKWRYEIPDGKYKRNALTVIKEKLKGLTLKDVYDSPELYKAYPQLKTLPFVIAENDANASFDGTKITMSTKLMVEDLVYSTDGEVMSFEKELGIKKALKGKERNAAIGSVLMHEIQHVVQSIEGFARGGNPWSYQVHLLSIDASEKILTDEYGELPSYIKAKEEGTIDAWVQNTMRETGKGLDRWEVYRRLAGETEARNVQTRTNMTPEQRRSTTLQETEDVAREDQILIGVTEPVLYTENVGVLRQYSIEGYHGSPYAFDRFTTEKIGTGEGAQAFGWGLYFADLESIARNYAVSLAEKQINLNKVVVKIDGIDVNTLKGRGLVSEGQVALQIKQAVLDFNGDLNNIKNYFLTLEEKYKRFDDKSILESEGKKWLETYRDILGILNKANNIEYDKPRNLYKVSLHKGKTPDQYTWLEWDKELDRPLMIKILSAIAKSKNESFDKNKFNTSLRYRTDAYDKYDIRMDEDGRGVYFRLSKALSGDKNASLFLLENGIDGIKYPAESIAGGRTSDNARGFNYVVFDENAVTIEERVQFSLAENYAKGIENGARPSIAREHAAIGEVTKQFSLPPKDEQEERGGIVHTEKQRELRQFVQDNREDFAKIKRQADKEELIRELAQSFDVTEAEALLAVQWIVQSWESFEGQKIRQSTARQYHTGMDVNNNGFYDPKGTANQDQYVQEQFEKMDAREAADHILKQAEEFWASLENGNVGTELVRAAFTYLDLQGEKEISQELRDIYAKRGTGTGRELESRRAANINNLITSFATVLADRAMAQARTFTNTDEMSAEMRIEASKEEIEAAIQIATNIKPKSGMAKAIQDVKNIFKSAVSKVTGKQFSLDPSQDGAVSAISEYMRKRAIKTSSSQVIYETIKGIQKANEESKFFTTDLTGVEGQRDINKQILAFFNEVLLHKTPTSTSTTAQILSDTTYPADMTKIMALLEGKVTAEKELKRLVQYVYSSNNSGGKTLHEMIVGNPILGYDLETALAIEKAVSTHMRVTYGKRVQAELKRIADDKATKAYFGENTTTFLPRYRAAVEKVIDAYAYGMLNNDLMKAVIAETYLGTNNVDIVDKLIELDKQRRATKSSLRRREIEKEASRIAYKANPSVIAKFVVETHGFMIKGLLAGVVTLYNATAAGFYVNLPRAFMSSVYMMFRGFGDWRVNHPFAFMTQANRAGVFKGYFTSLFSAATRGDSATDTIANFIGDDTVNTFGSVPMQTKVERASTKGFSDLAKSFGQLRNTKSRKDVQRFVGDLGAAVGTTGLRLLTVLKVFDQACAAITVPYIAYVEALEEGRSQGLKAEALLEFAKKKAGFDTVQEVEEKVYKELQNLATQPSAAHMFKKDKDGNVITKEVTINKEVYTVPTPTIRYKDLISSLYRDFMLEAADNEFTSFAEYMYKDMQMMGQPEGMNFGTFAPFIGMNDAIKGMKQGVLKDPKDLPIGEGNIFGIKYDRAKWHFPVGAVVRSSMAYGLFPFGRIITQTITTMWKYSIFGAVSSTINRFGLKDSTVYVGETTARSLPEHFTVSRMEGIVDRRKVTNREYYEQIMVALSSTAAFLYYLNDMFDWDDDGFKLDPERTIDITATGKGDFFTNAKFDSTHKNVSMREKKKGGDWGDYYTYKFDMMRMPYLYALGTVRDMAYFSDQPINQSKLATALIAAPLASITEQSFAMTLNTAKNIAKELNPYNRRDDEAIQGQEYADAAYIIAEELGMKPLRTVLTLGNLTRDLVSDIRMVKQGQEEYHGVPFQVKDNGSDNYVEPVLPKGYRSKPARDSKSEKMLAAFFQNTVWQDVFLDGDVLTDSFGNPIPKEFASKVLADQALRNLGASIPIVNFFAPGDAESVTDKERVYNDLPEIKLFNKFPTVGFPTKFRPPTSPGLYNEPFTKLNLDPKKAKDDTEREMIQDVRKRMQLSAALQLREYIRNEENYKELDAVTDPVVLEAVTKMITSAINNNTLSAFGFDPPPTTEFTQGEDSNPQMFKPSHYITKYELKNILPKKEKRLTD